MSTRLPPLGALAPTWRPHLAGALDGRATGDVVVDCRSAPYAAAWKVPAGAEHVAVRVLRELDGRRSVVSHNAKHTRGILTGHLLTRAEPVHSAEELLKAAYELVGTALLDATLLPGHAGRRRWSSSSPELVSPLGAEHAVAVVDRRMVDDNHMVEERPAHARRRARCRAYGSLGHPTTVSSVAPSAHSRTMLTEPGGTRKPAQREGGASIARPTAARTCTA
ncbi:peroxide stress protein YaaA [Oerskovia sp. M15]